MPRKTIQKFDEQTGFYAFHDQQPYDIYNGKTLDIKNVGKRERPDTLPDQFKQAREWGGENWFVNTIVELKSAFANYRPVFVCASKEKAPRDKFKRWLDEAATEHGETNGMQAHDYVAGALREWYLTDNLVSFWRRESDWPYPLRPELLRFTDTFGTERLFIRIEASEKELLDQGMTAEQARKFANGKLVELKPENGEYWLVARRGARGFGLIQPRMHTVFRTLSQAESMEVGETMYAYAGRMVLRFHQFGFEVKSAANALRQQDYLWKKPRAEAVEKFFKGRQGFAETTGQFDHKISHIWTDPKLYENKKWLTITDRLLAWAGPLGYLLMSKVSNLPLLSMLETEISADRQRLKAHLEVALNRAMRPPGGLRLRWGNKCFTDPRLAWDMVKSLAQMGPLSPQTAVASAGFDPEEEAELKVAAADDEKGVQKYHPLYDAAHGPTGALERRGPKPGLKQRKEAEPQ